MEERSSVQELLASLDQITSKVDLLEREPNKKILFNEVLSEMRRIGQKVKELRDQLSRADSKGFFIIAVHSLALNVSAR